MENIEENVFLGKTSEEAIEAGLAELGLKREEAEITVLEEGKKKLFGSVKARVRIVKRATDGKRAANFIDGLFEILKINAFAELVSDDEKIEINVQTAKSQNVIGHHGEILDAIQTIAGAVANIGNDEYKKVVVDCENYRASREKTLIELANKLAKKAVEKGRKVTLEPMNPYERRIIHSALAKNTEVKTASDGREPNRYVVIIPNNAKPYERGERKPRSSKGERRDFKGDRKRSGDRDRGERRERSSSPRPAKRGKKEIHFGTYLGNSGATAEVSTEKKDEE
ncbi:MAG: RNA-binding cell elongation regulator Jag/EloR [Candidatus Coproplasma sp.]